MQGTNKEEMVTLDFLSERGKNSAEGDWSYFVVNL